MGLFVVQQTDQLSAAVPSSRDLLSLPRVNFLLLRPFPPALIHLANRISLQVTILKAQLTNLCEEFAALPSQPEPWASPRTPGTRAVRLVVRENPTTGSENMS